LIVSCFPVVQTAVESPNITHAGVNIKNGRRMGPRMYLSVVMM